MSRLYDIDLNDVALRAQYYNDFFYGDVESAQGLINDNPQLRDKVINADNLNRLVDGLLEIEGYYFRDFINVMNGHLLNFNISIDDLVYCTNYDSTIQYEKNNFVLYNDSLYYCYNKPPIGTNPTNTSYWLYLGLKGESGDTVTTMGVVYKGTWEQGNYLKDDMVLYNDSLYVALQNTNTTPTDSNYWLEMNFTVTRQKIYVSATEPVVPIGVTDVIWVEVLN